MRARTSFAGRTGASAALAAALLAFAICGVRAEAPTRDPASSQLEYERVASEIVVSEERMAALAAEIATMRKDQSSITAALIQSAKTEKKLSEDIEDIAGRLEKLKREEGEIRLSLEQRRGVLAEVLGALQRMGLNPPPAILVRPEDALGSIRSAILLGAVVPELRAETDILIADLRELSQVAASIQAERDRLAASVTEQLAEKQRLSLLLDQKERLQGVREAALGAEKQRAEELAGKAKSLKDLIAALEEQAKADEAERKRIAEQEKQDEELAALPVPEANQLAAPVPFAALVGQLSLPAAGKFKLRFGQDDGNGGVMQGDTVATQSAAIVTAPSDGSVLYAGPFRSYGQLLILNAGDGYHIVLAGMSRISVAAGQSVLAGEPVGAMGDTRVASTEAVSSENAAPELYLEFRKDGKPVDPAPWWAERLSGRTGNGT